MLLNGKMILASCAVGLLHFGASICIASQFAFDSAADPAYNTSWQSGVSNGGFGWGGPWGFGTSTGGNTFWNVASSTLNGNDGSINSPIGLTGRAWEITSSDLRPGLESAARPLNGSLLVGQTISLDFDNAFPVADQGVPGEGAQIFEIASVAPHSTDLPFTFNAKDNFADYQITDADGINTFHDTGVPLTNAGLQLAFTLTSPTTYSFSITPLNSGAATTVITGPITNEPINTINFVDVASGSQSGNALFFNNISVPEPGSGLVIGITFSLLKRKPRKDS